MLLSSLLASLLATAATLASPMPAPIPAEIDPIKGPFEKPAETTWYCAYSYEIVFEHYELVGWKWGIDEQELRKLIPGMVKGYYFNKTSEYGFRAEVSLVPFVPPLPALSLPTYLILSGTFPLHFVVYYCYSTAAGHVHAFVLSCHSCGRHEASDEYFS
jgi:hypothetical protein